MKKAVLFVLLTISVGFLSAQEFYLNPIISVARIDTTGARLVRQLAYEITSGKNQSRFIVSGEIATGSRELRQRYAVFVHDGKRYSVYYQWDISDFPCLWNYDFLRVSVRSEGTDNPENLKSYKDYHLNGSWDDYFDGQYISLAEYEPDYTSDSTQNIFLKTVKEALGFFK